MTNTKDPLKPSVLSRVLNQIRLLRSVQREEVENDLWGRNGLSNPKTREGYMLLDATRVTESGEERTRFRLWKLVDEEELTITTSITSQRKTPGKEQDRVNTNRTPPADNSESPI